MCNCLYVEPYPLGMPFFLNGPQDLRVLAKIGREGRYDVHLTRTTFFDNVLPSLMTLVNTTPIE